MSGPRRLEVVNDSNKKLVFCTHKLIAACVLEFCDYIHHIQYSTDIMSGLRVFWLLSFAVAMASSLVRGQNPTTEQLKRSRQPPAHPPTSLRGPIVILSLIGLLIVAICVGACVYRRRTLARHFENHDKLHQLDPDCVLRRTRSSWDHYHRRFSDDDIVIIENVDQTIAIL